MAEDDMRHAAPSILAVDLGTTTGWALHARGQFKSGSFRTKLHATEHPGLRFLRFRREFLSTFRGVREVWFELVRRHEGTHAAHIYGGFWAELMAWCQDNGVRWRAVEVGDIKRTVAGRGNATKKQMMAAVEELGFRPADDNEADALAILHVARQRDIDDPQSERAEL